MACPCLTARYGSKPVNNKLIVALARELGNRKDQLLHTNRRKIVQIAAASFGNSQDIGTIIYALCADGALWMRASERTGGR